MGEYWKVESPRCADVLSWLEAKRPKAPKEQLYTEGELHLAKNPGRVLRWVGNGEPHTQEVVAALREVRGPLPRQAFETIWPIHDDTGIYLGT